MSNKFGKDLTVGSIPKHLLAFSIPMLIGNLLNIGYSLINTIWVGRTIGEDALAASTVSFPILFILIGLASGATMATTILVSQYYGAKDFKTVEKVVNTSFSVSIIFGLFLTLAGILSSDLLLKLMGTPDEVFKLASSYLKISLAGFVFQFLSYLIASILRGIGDTVTPLVFMGGGMVLNAILDPLLILGIGPFPKLGLDGAAYASLIAMAIAFVFGLLYLNHKNHIVAFNPAKLALDKHLVFLIFKIGFPSMIQQSLVSIGSAFITGFVNVYGAAATAAFGAAGRIDSIAFLPALSFSMAASALTGQNLGANKPERVKEIFKAGILMTSVVTLFVSLIAVSIPRITLTLFGLNGEALEIGVTYLRIVGSSYIFFAIMFVCNGIINGAGHTMITMMFSLLSLWVVRVPLSYIFTHYTNLGLIGIWISMVLSFGVVMAISLLYYFSGKWKRDVIGRSGPISDPGIE